MSRLREKTTATLLIAIFMISILAVAIPVNAQGSIWTVPGDYDTIQAAINAASPGDTIIVAAGTYYENVVVNKTVFLIGQDKEYTIIDGSKKGDAIYVKANDVKISGFTIRNADTFEWHSGWGIYIRDSSGSNVSGNTIINNKGGICIEYSRSIGNANAIIEYNFVGSNYEGISLYRSDNCTINGNNVTDSYNSGIYLFFSSDNKIRENRIENTEYIGICLRYQSNNNTIYHNNIISNKIQASTSNSNAQPRNNNWDDGYPSGGNYWDDYHGTDNDGDGIGDTPYIIDEDTQDCFPYIQVKAPEPSLRPAEFVVTGLMFLEPEVEVGGDNTITVVIGNVGEQSGSYAVNVRLESGPIVIVDEAEVTLEGGKAKMVHFTFTLDVKGTYKVEADGLEINFDVVPVVIPPRPAKFEFSNLEVSPEEVKEGEAVTVSVDMTNVGEEEGSHTVELKVDRYVVDSEEVTLEGGAFITVLFELTRGEGTYQVEVEGMIDRFTVFTLYVAAPFWMQPGYIAGILILILAISAAIYAYWKGILPPLRARTS